MKARLFFISVLFLFSTNGAFSSDHDSLQKQIDELNRKVEKQDYSKYLEGLNFHGRLHVNGSWYNEDDQLSDYGNNSYNNKFSIKRARLSLSKEFDSFLINFEGNFNEDRAYLGENYIAYNIGEGNMLRVGQVVAPGFIEREKSSNTMAAIDYNALEQMKWLRYYLIGLDYSYVTDKFGIRGGLYGNGTSEEGDLENDISYNLSLRGYYTPIRSGDYLIHIGADLIYQGYSDDQSNNSDEVDYAYYYGLELILQYKFASLTVEYLEGYYNYDDIRFDGEKFNFDALSAEFVVNFTGEHTTYNRSGYLGNIDVKRPLSGGGIGAFQGVLRYSFADGKDTSGGFLDNIGSLYEYTVGVSWIPENYLRVMFNYSHNRVTGANYAYRGEYDAFKLEIRMFF